MKLVIPAKMRISLAIFCAFGGLGSQALYAASSMSADDIIHRAVDRAQRPRGGAGEPAYIYTKVTVTEELDSTGKIKERKEKLYQVHFHGGATQVKLLEVNGRAPAGADLKKQSENEDNVHAMTGKSKSERKDDHE